MVRFVNALAAVLVMLTPHEEAHCRNVCHRDHCDCFTTCDGTFPGDYEKQNKCKAHCEALEEKCMKRCTTPRV